MHCTFIYPVIKQVEQSFRRRVQGPPACINQNNFKAQSSQQFKVLCVSCVVVLKLFYAHANNRLQHIEHNTEVCLSRKRDMRCF